MAKKKKKKSGECPISPKDLLGLFREVKRPIKMNDFYRFLNLSKRWRDDLEAMIEFLEKDGKIIRLRGGAWGLTKNLHLLPGKLQVQRSGVGFVLPKDKRRADIFVAPSAFGTAMHGDTVMVAVLPGKRGKNPDGRIVRVLERARDTITCRVIKKMGKDGYICRPTDSRLNFSILATGNALDRRPRKNELLVVEPSELVEGGLWAATIIESLGNEEEGSVQERLVKINNDIPTSFADGVIEAAKALPSVPSEEDFVDRIDLRSLDFVTIDGADARDFDDAIYVEEQRDGYRLWVAIADVSHYVQEDSVLDQEAVERANSYYFPQSVEPMFPVELSNGLCSLNPRVPRLAMVAETYFYADGSYGKSKFYPAVIQSKARLTYEQVQSALVDKNEKERAVVAPVLPMLERAEELAHLLRQKRIDRGSLDFDLPEAKITFDVVGDPIAIDRRIRHFSHMMIEEFMIAANEAVARFLTKVDVPFLYRVHPEPELDKLSGLFKMLHRTDLGEAFPREPSAENLQAVLKIAEGTEQEFVVNRLTLRTMMQAQYTAVHQTHYGLASDCYCHFTSPIRRYADLVVHRALKHALKMKGYENIRPVDRIQPISDHLNKRERVAMEAEREILKRITALYMLSHIGAEFTGVISGVSDFGFWVELEEVMAEGMVRLSSIDDDYYVYLSERNELVGERTARRFALGQVVKVWLYDVNVGRMEINFKLREEDFEDQ
ncbi:ribonuclease R [Halodesulfovibrio marinisediminis]|uniref:Ribonuclease R n=1 Tax=Halodesulfovibrio marinisediminis DSM 17456 TaxID=1121457 RepID=A0A1N6HKU4_9BACT|nr:ribonuclease R [Halodesulfovibrio marinisediminis]SIO20265.1 RNAse R [Halodesulfovibrio marinisediminis DSM 17456]